MTLRSHFILRLTNALAILLFSMGMTLANAAPLSVDVYNPGEKAIFPVTSTLISGKQDAILIDAQFQRSEAEKLVQRIKASGKRLTTIYISHPDPDFYFGLNVLQDAFPQAKIVATAATLAAIKESIAGKLIYWGPIMKTDAPNRLVFPDVLTGNTLQLEGETIEIKGSNLANGYLWIPSIKTIAGGVMIFNEMHVWVADSQTPAAQQQWLNELQQMKALSPVRVIPGHFLGQMPSGSTAIDFTAEYLKSFAVASSQAANSASLINTMKHNYPTLGALPILETSAKVLKGEMKWPQ